MLPITTRAAALANDSVLSQNVKEADGTSGQDTNIGSGIKTGHLQDGAVTDAKVTGPISSSKISSAGLNADTVDGQHATTFATVTPAHDGMYQRRYACVVTVSKDGGGDFTDPVAALEAIVDASAANPYLVKILPGNYEVPASALVAKSYVDIEGSGRGVTRISSSNPGYMGPPETLNYYYVNDSELRNITISMDTAVDAPSNSAGLTLAYATNIRLLDVDVVVTSPNAPTDNYGIIVQADSDVRLENVRVAVQARLPANENGIALDNNAIVRARGGTIDSSGTSVFVRSTSATFLGANVELGVSPYAVGGTLRCVGCFDASFSPLNVP